MSILWTILYVYKRLYTPRRYIHGITSIYYIELYYIEVCVIHVFSYDMRDSDSAYAMFVMRNTHTQRKQHTCVPY